MASNHSEEAEELESVKVERDYWKESYMRLASCHTCIEEYSQSAKRARLEEEENSSMDPFTLPEPCVRSILKNFKGKEILKLMEVSKSWKEYIESRKSLMDRAFDPIVVKPSIQNFSISMIDHLLENSFKRGYKHMKSPLILYRRSKLITPLIKLNASTLESLIILKDEFNNSKTNYLHQRIERCVFPVLRKLNIHSGIPAFVHNSSYPMLTHLAISSLEGPKNLEQIDGLTNFLSKCPKLETLWCGFSIEKDRTDFFFQETDSSDEDNSAHTFTKRNQPSNQPKLKNLFMFKISKIFLQDHQNSLVKLEISTANFYEDFFWVIQHLKVLKSLSIVDIVVRGNNYRNQERIFLQNESIEVFKLERIVDRRLQIERANPIPLQMLLTLPSLTNLVLLQGLTEERINFIALNMIHLKKLTCREINQSLRLAYEDIQSNPDRYINSTFDFIDDPYYQINQIKNEMLF